MSFICKAVHDNSVANILSVSRPLGILLVVFEP